MAPQAFDRMRDLVLVSAATNLPVAAAALVLAVAFDVPGDWDSFLVGMATMAVLLALLLPYTWWSLRRMKGEARLPDGAEIRTRSEILAGSTRGLLLWAGFTVVFTVLFGTYIAGLAAGAAVLGPLFLLPIGWAERRRSCEIFIDAERSADRSQAATRYWTRPTGRTGPGSGLR